MNNTNDIDIHRIFKKDYAKAVNYFHIINKTKNIIDSDKM